MKDKGFLNSRERLNNNIFLLRLLLAGAAVLYIVFGAFFKAGPSGDPLSSSQRYIAALVLFVVFISSYRVQFIKKNLASICICLATLGTLQTIVSIHSYGYPMGHANSIFIVIVLINLLFNQYKALFVFNTIVFTATVISVFAVTDTQIPRINYISTLFILTCISFLVAVIRKKQEDKILDLTFHDSLTGLYNRAYLEEEIRRLDTERQLPLSVIVADVNGLKLINDTVGHEQGDTLLKKAADVLQKSCRKEDIIARYGGDEFVVLLPQTKKEDTDAICKRIRKRCLETELEKLPVSLALGCATKTDADQKIYEVIDEADESMYKNKMMESPSGKSSIIATLLKTLRAKSYETEEHAWRMQKMAFAVGEEIGLSTSELDRLTLLVTLHDIGKISVSEEILKKTGSLKDEEWKMIKKHPEKAYTLLSATEHFSHVAEEVLHHHEYWDGTGYPNGLEEDEIPILSRITAIVDAYDAMTNQRPYNPNPKSPKEAIHELKRCAGTQFDPDLVDVFARLFTKESIKK